MRYISALLLLLCSITPARAQWAHTQHHSATYDLFNLSDEYAYNCHEVYLENNEWMIIQLADVTDYLMLRNMDSLMNVVWQDIQVFRDSSGPMENVRVDYAMKLETDESMMRFKKYAPDGSIMIKKGGELSMLKVEKDTIRFIIRKQMLEHNSHMHFYDFPVQVTFLLNNYTNLGRILNDRNRLNSIIDSLGEASIPVLYDPNISFHRTTALYYPYRPGRRVIIQRTNPPVAVQGNHKKRKKLNQLKY